MKLETSVVSRAARKMLSTGSRAYRRVVWKRTRLVAMTFLW
jgi:hypothetical protein